MCHMLGIEHSFKQIFLHFYSLFLFIPDNLVGAEMFFMNVQCYILLRLYSLVAEILCGILNNGYLE